MSGSPGRLITRRRVVVGGVGVASAVALAYAAWLPAPAEGRSVLGPDEQDVIDALGEAMFPLGNPVGPSWRDVDLVAEVDRVLEHCLPDQAVIGFRYLCSALNWSALVVAGRPLTACTIAERLELFEALEQRGSVVRRAARDGLRGVLALAYFDHPMVWRAIGYRSRCTGEPA